MKAPRTTPEALEQAWELLAATARSELGVELPREAVLDEADRVATDASWGPLEYLLAWHRFLEESGELPPVLADLVQESRP